MIHVKCLLLAVVLAALTGCVVEPARVHVPEICAGHVGGTRNGGLVIEPPHECRDRQFEQPRYLPF